MSAPCVARPPGGRYGGWRDVIKRWERSQMCVSQMLTVEWCSHKGCVTGRSRQGFWTRRVPR
ncbi:hypothetical protein SXIM_04330 [Streptomyces xiamenensis]|uniref:Uncharacterized protein n=1 Tax=Streptomyces xiamenensis TaxID=408015 RepID=A0A0F7FPQ5_9ACTN|nr:hypothetical protein SXIM_04330 [Streptomyces xiamenensis]